MAIVSEGATIARSSAIPRSTTGQHRQIEILWHFPDVVLRRQHPVHMLVNGQPAVALGVVAGGIKGPRGLDQLLQQLGVGGGKAHGEGTDCQRIQFADPSIMAGPDLPRSLPHAARAIPLSATEAAAGHGPRLAERAASGLGLFGLVLLALGTVCRHPVLAQPVYPNQPEAIGVRRGIPPVPCPLLVPPKDAALQPLRIAPNQVAMKNSMGCLSPADASLYGPDGCPVKLCKLPQGTVPLPNR